MVDLRNWPVFGLIKMGTNPSVFGNLWINFDTLNDSSWNYHWNGSVFRRFNGNHFNSTILTSKVGSPVERLRSRNSSWIVVTSEVVESAFHLGGWAFLVPRLTSEYGTPDEVLKLGKRSKPNSSCKSVKRQIHITYWFCIRFTQCRPRYLTALSRNSWSPDKWYVLSNPPNTRIVVSNKLISRFPLNCKESLTQLRASLNSIQMKYISYSLS